MFWSLGVFLLHTVTNNQESFSAFCRWQWKTFPMNRKYFWTEGNAIRGRQHGILKQMTLLCHLFLPYDDRFWSSVLVWCLCFVDEEWGHWLIWMCGKVHHTTDASHTILPNSHIYYSNCKDTQHTHGHGELNSSLEDLGFNSRHWLCEEVSGKLRIQHCFSPPSCYGYLVLRSKVRSIVASCTSAHLARGKVKSVEHA